MTEASSSDTTAFGFREVATEDKARLVRGVFDRSARHYDLMNDLMSLGVHRVWKEITITKANPSPGERLIDVAGGTGDLARAFLDRAQARRKRRGGAPAEAVVADINAQMMFAGLKRGGAPGLSWVCADAERLPFEDASADCVIIGFGIRNVTRRDRALADMRRVLKPGGRFLSLEFSRPTTRALSRVYDAWSFNVIPKLGQLIARDRDSYQYLVESIRRFPHQEAFKAEIEAAGFKNVAITHLSGGVAALHVGWKL